MEEIKWKTAKKNNTICKFKPNVQKELFLEKNKSDFNLVAIKARNRLNELTDYFNKRNYDKYLRNCKNMYSISCRMNNKYSISSLYQKEKKNIPKFKFVLKNLRSFFEKSKNINSQVKIKKDTTNMHLENNSTPSKLCDDYNSINVKDENQISKMTSNKSIELNNINNQAINIRKNKDLTNNIYFQNNNAKVSNNEIGKIETPENKIDINKRYQFLKVASFPNFNKRKKNNKKINFNYAKNFNSFTQSHSKTKPISYRSEGFSFSTYGAIIYNKSIFRNKNIVNYIPKNFNLPLLYSYNKLNK